MTIDKSIFLPDTCDRCGISVQDWNAQNNDSLEKFPVDWHMSHDRETGEITSPEFITCPACCTCKE